MPTTTYTQIDYINVNEDSASFVNCSVNLGTPPNAIFSGLDAGAWSTGTTYSNSCVGIAVYSWEVDHSTPSTPVTPGAQITKITIRFQLDTITAVAFIDGTSGGLVDVSCGAQAFISSTLPNVAWRTSENLPSDTAADHVSNVTSWDQNAVAGPVSDLVEIVFDFTLNPNGDFPALYMDYATFIANFTNYDITYWLLSTVGTNGISSGDQSVSGGIDAVNLQIEVIWTDPYVSEWSVDPATLTLPDNTITLSRPDVGEDPDIEDIEEIKIGDTIIKPSDIWVTLWTKLVIIFKVPPNETDATGVYAKFRGTEFTGFVLIGPIVIVEADLSGIYQLDVTQHHDTLYARDGTTVTTQEVAIPSPFFITYFVDNKEIDVCHYTGTRMRVTGQGIVNQLFLSLDTVQTEQFGNLTLQTSGNLSPFALANFIDQQAALRVSTTEYDDYMVVSQIVIFWKKLYSGYPQ
jgi:hypothetical protein